jgi:hypothetical protein
MRPAAQPARVRTPFGPLEEESSLRKLFIGALVGAMALAVAAVAFGATQQNFTMNFGKPAGGSFEEIQKPKKNTGITVDLSSSNTDDPNAQPAALRELFLHMPEGTKVNPKAAKFCNATDNELQNEGPDACPGKSEIGAGSATARAPDPNLPQIDVEVTAFNRKSGLLLYLQPSLLGVRQQPFFLRPEWEGKLKDGPTLHTVIPPNCAASTNVDGRCVNNDGSDGQEIVLNSFDLTTEPVKKVKKGKKKKNGKRKKKKFFLIQTPKACPNAGWEFRGEFRFSDGTEQNLPYQDNCVTK